MTSFFYLVGMSLMAINPVVEEEIDFSSVNGSNKRLNVDWTYEEEVPSEPSDRASSRASSVAPIIVVDTPDPDMEGVTIDLECNLQYV